MWTEIALGILVAYNIWQHIRLAKIRKSVLMVVNLVANFLKLTDEQHKINKSQKQLNEAIANNLEILGVHTKLIEPDIAYEASAFLAWINHKRKREDNG
jgi:uncharacterized protein with HEPN domain